MAHHISGPFNLGLELIDLPTRGDLQLKTLSQDLEKAIFFV